MFCCGVTPRVAFMELLQSLKKLKAMVNQDLRKTQGIFVLT